MFSNKLKRPALALAVTAGLLAVAGPASAQGSDRVGAPSLKYETEVTDYVRLSTASDVDTPRLGVKWELSEYDAITSGANAFRPEVNDEVLAGVNYEIDVFW